MRALEGITILDLTHMLSGPYGTMLMADMGARTIKIEPPGKGEGTRRLLEHAPLYSRDGMGAYFPTLCHNKESEAIDLVAQGMGGVARRGTGYAAALSLSQHSQHRHRQCGCALGWRAAETYQIARDG